MALLLAARAAAEAPLPAVYHTHSRAGFELGYHPSARGVRPLIEQAERIRAELVEILGRPLLATVNVRIAVNGADLERIVPAGAPLAREVITDPSQALIAFSVERLGSDDAVLEAFRRGMAELALAEAGGPGLPRWLRAGFAGQFAEPESLSRSRALWWASMQSELVALDRLDAELGDPPLTGSLAEAEAADVVRWLLRDRGSFQRLVARVHQGRSFDAALASSYQLDRPALEARWRGDVARHRAFLPILFGGTVLWLAIAAVVVARRLRRKKPAAAPPPQPRVQIHVVRAPRKKRELPIALHDHDPDVPKVSHNGRWHTLH